MKNIKGITLISLVVTIVILLMLACIVINLGIGDNKLFNKTKYAKEETNKQTATEKINLKITTAQINKYSEEQRMPTLKELSVSLGNDKEIEYVTEVSQIANTKYEVGEAPTTIFTKLKDYKYEFEINSCLQLASIDGIEMATNVKQSNMQVLWENPSKTEVFNEQIINWGENNTSQGTKEGAAKYEYNYLIIEYHTGALFYSQMISKGASMVCKASSEDSSGNSYYIEERMVEYIDNTSLKFRDVQVFQFIKTGGFNKFSKWNTRCVPTKIIGIK